MWCAYACGVSCNKGRDDGCKILLPLTPLFEERTRDQGLVSVVMVMSATITHSRRVSNYAFNREAKRPGIYSLPE